MNGNKRIEELELDTTAQPLPQEVEEGNIEYKVNHFMLFTN